MGRAQVTIAVFVQTYIDFMEIRRFSHGYLTRVLYSAESSALCWVNWVSRNPLRTLECKASLNSTAVEDTSVSGRMEK